MFDDLVVFPLVAVTTNCDRSHEHSHEKNILYFNTIEVNNIVSDRDNDA